MRRTQGIVQYIVVIMRYIQLVRVSIQTNNNLQYTFHDRVGHFTDWLQIKFSVAKATLQSQMSVRSFVRDQNP